MLRAAQPAKGLPTINVGLFLNATIDFLIVAFAVFLLVKQVNRLRSAPQAAAPRQEVLVEEIRDLLKTRA